METAKGGTLFLDEIGDVPLAMQGKLLRLIETGTYRRVGERRDDIPLLVESLLARGASITGKRMHASPGAWAC